MEEECRRGESPEDAACVLGALRGKVGRSYTRNAANSRATEERDCNPHRFSQRLKQIEYGKNTPGYHRYRELISKKRRQVTDPQTPDIKQVCSKRSWDGQLKRWRRLLHEYDNKPEKKHEDHSPDNAARGSPSGFQNSISLGRWADVEDSPSSDQPCSN